MIPLVVAGLIFFSPGQSVDAVVLTNTVVMDQADADLVLLKERQEAIFAAFVRRDFGGVFWDMLTRSVQEDNAPKKKFVKDLEAFLGDKPVRYVHWDAAILEPRYLAKTQTMVFVPMDIGGNVAPVPICIGVVWLWEGDTWKVVRDYSCEREADMLEDLKQWKRPPIRVPSDVIMAP